MATSVITSEYDIDFKKALEKVDAFSKTMSQKLEGVAKTINLDNLIGKELADKLKANLNLVTNVYKSEFNQQESVLKSGLAQQQTILNSGLKIDETEAKKDLAVQTGIIKSSLIEQKRVAEKEKIEINRELSNIKINEAQGKAEIARQTNVLKSELKQQELVVSESGNRLKRIIDFTISNVLSAGVFGALGGIGQQFSKALDFEAAISEIRSLNLTDITGKIRSNGELDKLTLSAKNLSLQLGKETKFSALDAAQGINELLKSGLTLEQAQAGIRGALDLAAAGEITVADAATIASTALNAFKSDNLSVAQAADILAGAANASATDINGLRLGLQAVSAVASGVGLSFKDTNVALGLFANNGLRGSDAGTSFKTFLLGLQPTTKKQKDLFEELGLTQNKVTTNFVENTKAAEKNKTKIQELNTQIQELTSKGLDKNSLSATKNTDKISKLNDKLGNLRDSLGEARAKQAEFDSQTKESTKIKVANNIEKYTSDIEKYSSEVQKLSTSKVNLDILPKDTQTRISKIKQQITELGGTVGDLKTISVETGNVFFDGKGNLETLPKIAGALRDALDEFTPKQRLANLEILFGSDAIRAANIIYKEGANGVEDLTKQIEKIKAADVARERLNNLKGRLEELSSTIETQFIIAFDKITPAITNSIRSITNFINNINLDEFFQKLGNGDFNGTINGITLIIGGLAILETSKGVISILNTDLDKLIQKFNIFNGLELKKTNPNSVGNKIIQVGTDYGNFIKDGFTQGQKLGKSITDGINSTKNSIIKQINLIPTYFDTASNTIKSNWSKAMIALGNIKIPSFNEIKQNLDIIGLRMRVFYIEQMKPFVANIGKQALLLKANFVIGFSALPGIVNNGLKVISNPATYAGLFTGLSATFATGLAGIGTALSGAFAGFIGILTSTAAFLLPIILIIAALAVVVGLVIGVFNYFNKVSGESKTILERLQQAGQFVVDTLTTGFQNFANFWNANIQPVFDKIVSYVIDKLVVGFNILKDQVFPIFNQVLKQVGDTFNTSLKPALDILFNQLKIIYDQIAPFIIPALGVLAGIIGVTLYVAFFVFIGVLQIAISVLSFLLTTVVNVFTLILSTVSIVLETVGAIIKAVWDTIVALFTGNGNKIVEIWGNAFVKIGELASNIWNNNIKPALINIFNSTVQLFSNVGGDIKRTFEAALNTAVEIIKKIDFLGAGRDTINGFLEGLKSAWGNITKWIETNFGNVVDIAKKILGIASPSKVFKMEIGYNIVKGLEVGLNQFSPLIDSAFARILTLPEIPDIGNLTDNGNTDNGNTNNKNSTASRNDFQQAPQYKSSSVTNYTNTKVVDQSTKTNTNTTNQNNYSGNNNFINVPQKAF